MTRFSTEAVALLLALFLAGLVGTTQGFQGTRLRRDFKMVRRASPTPSSRDESDSSSQFSVPSVEKMSSSELTTQPKFKIGILADIQYAPIPDGTSFAGTPRYYRHALDVARHAAKHFTEDGAEVVLNLGDIIDGKCQAITANGGESLPEGTDPGLSAMEDVLEALSHYQQGPIIHTYGESEKMTHA